MSNRRIVTVLLAAVLALTACGDPPAEDSEASESSTSAAPTSATTTSRAPTRPVLAYPATDNVDGVAVSSQPGAPVQTFACKPRLESIEVPYLAGVEFGGTNVVFDDQSSENPETAKVLQDTATITFDGEPIHVISMIIRFKAQDLDPEGNTIVLPDKVVNFNDTLRSAPGVVLKTTDFTERVGNAIIFGVTVCVQPAEEPDDSREESTDPSPTGTPGD